MQSRTRVFRPEIMPADDAAFAQGGVHFRNRARAAQGEFVKEGRSGDDLVVLQRSDLRGGVVRLVPAEFGHLTQAMLPHQGQIDGGGQRHQPLVGADVAAGLFAPYVLLARPQGHHPGAATVLVHGLTDDAAGDFAHETRARGEEPT